MEIRAGQAVVVFNKMFVNAVETNSGIFVGVNNAIGWSSHGKSNSGFGSASNCQISNSINVVNDQDVIDAPIEDRKQIIMHLPQETAANSNVNFESINANALVRNSTISVGETSQTGWTAHHKTNYGNGKSYGLNVLKRLANCIDDKDYVDSPIEHNQTY